MFTWGAIKGHLLGMGHGGTLNKVRNIEQLAERAASSFQLKAKPVQTMRRGVLSHTVLDDVFNYLGPTDFGSLIDLIPQDNRTTWDKAYRNLAGQFDLEKARVNRTVSIEGDGGEKIIRVNWRTRAPKVLNSMNSVTSNGTWGVVGTASNVSADEIMKRNGSASIKFDVAADGDGIQNSTMSAIDCTTENQIGDIFYDLLIENATDLAAFEGITTIWGNDLTTAFWTGSQQVAQADGTAFRAGWNVVRVPWETATQKGTVAPASIDSLKFTLNILSPITGIRIDNVRVGIGRPFELKYYSKFLYKDSTTGVYKSLPSSDDDLVTIDNDSLPLYLFELLKGMAHQVEGTDAAFDINYARQELEELFPHFRSENQDQRKKAVGRYTRGPRWSFRRSI